MKRSKRYGFSTVFVSLAILAIISAPASAVEKWPTAERWPHNPKAKYGGNLIFGGNSHPTTLNPNLQNEPGCNDVAGSVYSKLVVIDFGVTSGVQPYGDLARKIEVSEEGKIYTFHLFENVKFHDGKPLTSADVKYTYEEIIKNKFPAYGYFLRFVDKIETPDAYTVRLVLKEPNGAFLSQMAMAALWYASILPKHLYEGTDWKTNPYNEKPIGSGPYKFKEWVKGSHVTLVRNEEWFRGRPYLDSIALRIIPDKVAGYNAFRAGEIHELRGLNHLPSYAEIPVLNKTAGLRLSHIASPYDRCIYFNLKKEPWNNIKVREAIAYAINREEVSKLGFFGTYPPLYYVGAFHMGDYLDKNLKFPSFDSKKAEQLLDEAGFGRKADGWRFKADFYNSPYADDTAVAEVVTEQLKKIGIDINRVQLDLGTWLGKVTKLEHDMTVYWVNYGADPASYADHFRAGGARNFMGYNNSRVNELLDKAVRFFDPEKRKPYYYDVQKILLEEKPWIPILNAQYFNAAWEDWKGFNWEPEGFGNAFSWFGYAAVWWEKGQPATPPATTTVTTPATTKTAIPAAPTFPTELIGGVVLVIVIAAIAAYVVTKRKKPT